jgi:hypothetical protein
MAEAADSDGPDVEEAVLCAPPGRVGIRAAQWYAGGDSDDSGGPSAPPLTALHPGAGVKPEMVNRMANSDVG